MYLVVNLDIPLLLFVVYLLQIPWFGSGGVRFRSRDHSFSLLDLVFR
jgi:hypothetical protein